MSNGRFDPSTCEYTGTAESTGTTALYMYSCSCTAVVALMRIAHGQDPEVYIRDVSVPQVLTRNLGSDPFGIVKHNMLASAWFL